MNISIPHPFYSTKFFLTFLITASCFLFTYFYYDFYYVEYEALFDSFYSGKLTEGLPFRSIYFLGNIGTSHLYSLLYEMNPNVEWISWILYSYLLVSCFIGLHLIISILPESVPLWMKIVAQAAIYFLVFADHNIHFIFTRVSYMATGLSLIALIYYFRLPGSVKERPWLFVFFNFWFIVGVLTRSESATAAFLQIGFFGIFYIQKIRRFIALFTFPALFLFSVLFAIAYDLKTSTEFYKQIEPEIEVQLGERENAVSLSSMKTYRDSVMYMAATDIMWSDPKKMTPNYLRSLIRSEKFIYTDSRHWERVYGNVTEIALKFWHLGLICMLLGISLLIQYRLTSGFSYVLWLAFTLSFWFLTAIQTYTVKVNDRSFLPLISLFILCHIVMLLPYLKSGLSKWLYPFLAAFIVLFGVHLNYLRTESNQLKQDLISYQKDADAITRLAAGKILVLNSSSCDYLLSSNKPFHPFDFSKFKKIYITDGFNIPFLPYYRRYLEKECQCDMMDFPSFWDYLRTLNEEVVVVSASQRMDILVEYLRVIHNYELPVTENASGELHQLQKSDSRGIFANLKAYNLGN